MRNRRGVFYISTKLIQDEPEVIMSEVMSRLIVVRAEMMWERDHIEYMAMSPDFDELTPGEMPPTYDVVITGPNARFVRRNV